MQTRWATVCTNYLYVLILRFIRQKQIIVTAYGFGLRPWKKTQHASFKETAGSNKRLVLQTYSFLGKLGLKGKVVNIFKV